MAMNQPEASYPRPFAVVDLAIFALSPDGPRVLLARRDLEPFAGAWALPGGFVRIDEDADIDAAARRVLRGKTRVETPYLEQVRTFGGATRDPRGWSISVAYFALVPWDETAGPDWRLIEDEGVAEPLAFDHAAILRAAISRLRAKVAYSSLPAHLLPEAFTLGELQSVYERILGRKLDKSAFRKRIADVDFVEAIQGEWRRGSNRPAQLYRLRQGGSTVLFDRTI